jgi:putative sensory transduction regulator
MFSLNRNRSQPNNIRLDSYAQTVQQILTGLGVNPDQVRIQTEEGYGWTFHRGSATIEVYVSQNENGGFFQVLSPIMHLPQSGLLPLYRRLLELNLQLVNISLGVYLDVVYVYSERPLDGMDIVEANSIINAVASYADELDDKLVAEFSGRPYSRV